MKNILAFIYSIIGVIIIAVVLLSPMIFWSIYSEPFYLLLFLVTPGIAFWVFTLIMGLFITLFE